MSDGKVLSYGKTDGKKEVFPLQTALETSPAKEEERGTVERHIDVPYGYSKQDGVLSYSIICVISGGTNRERTFLTQIEKKRFFRTCYNN
mgnify:CR=1 FL=1